MGAEDRYGLAERTFPMIKSVVAAAVLSAGLVGYATAQEVSPIAVFEGAVKVCWIVVSEVDVA